MLLRNDSPGRRGGDDPSEVSAWLATPWIGAGARSRLRPSGAHRGFKDDRLGSPRLPRWWNETVAFTEWSIQS